jgi:hypothetical protein
MLSVLDRAIEASASVIGGERERCRAAPISTWSRQPEVLDWWRVAGIPCRLTTRMAILGFLTHRK